VKELSEKLADFRLAYNEGALPVERFANYGPVQLFRNNFIAGYEHLLAEIKTRREAKRDAFLNRASTGGVQMEITGL
jgi:hypothetical protein